MMWLSEEAAATAPATLMTRPATLVVPSINVCKGKYSILQFTSFDISSLLRFQVQVIRVIIIKDHSFILPGRSIKIVTSPFV
jgi:hypothetical protein